MPNPGLPTDWNFQVSAPGLGLAVITVPGGGPVTCHVITTIQYKIYCVGAPGGVFAPALQVLDSAGVLIFGWSGLTLDMTTYGETGDTLTVNKIAPPGSLVTVQFSAPSPNLFVGENLNIAGYTI